MESFKNFKNRIYSFQVNSIEEDLNEFNVNPNLGYKVDEEGRIKSFYGDTVVFDLKEEENIILKEIQNILYDNCKDYLGDRLPSHTFHMTLHDLNNSKDFKVVEDLMKKNEVKVKEIFKTLSREEKAIKMKKTYVFNMVNTSIVLGLEPVDEENHNRLISLYDKFNEVVKLSYPLTPHITLGYFKNKNIDSKGIEKLKKAIEEMNKVDLKVELELSNLSYKHFDSMISYKSILVKD